MAIDETLAEHVRAALRDASLVREVKMFGGLGFMLNGNMVAAASPRGLLVRVGEAGKAEAVARGAKPMVMKGREMKGFVWVVGHLDARVVKSWLRLGRAFVDTMPAKEGKKESKKESKTESKTKSARSRSKKS